MMASSLFHFTKKSEILLLILTQLEFRASYNIEDVSDFYPSVKYVGIPMICFCDIPLKFISEHPMVYGKFGIGLKKEWGLTKGINPVQYRTDNSSFSKAWTDSIEIINRNLTTLSPSIAPSSMSSTSSTVFYDFATINDKVLKATAFSKLYKSTETINYHDREWRYVPDNARIPIVKRENQRNKLNREYFKDPFLLKYGISDIQHIIAPSKAGVLKLIKGIQAMPLNETNKYKLCQLIIDLKSIKKDF